MYNNLFTSEKILVDTHFGGWLKISELVETNTTVRNSRHRKKVEGRFWRYKRQAVSEVKLAAKANKNGTSFF